METFFKKYFWVLTLSTVTATAFLSAQTAVELGVERFLPSDSSLELSSSHSDRNALYQRSNSAVVGDEFIDERFQALEGKVDVVPIVNHPDDSLGIGRLDGSTIVRESR